jgi:hypothetical protein
MEEIKKIRLSLCLPGRCRGTKHQYQIGGDVADRSTPSVTCTGTGAAGGGATIEGEAWADAVGEGEAVAVGVAGTASGRYHNWKWPACPCGAK